jgi:hypothetical protein
MILGVSAIGGLDPVGGLRNRRSYQKVLDYINVSDELQYTRMLLQ